MRYCSLSALLGTIKRRLGDIEITALDDLRHLPIEECQQKRPDMAAIDIGIRHDDDLVIARLFDVEVFSADAGTECGNQRAEFGRGQYLVKTRPFDIQDLAAQGQNRLVFTVARLFG